MDDLFAEDSGDIYFYSPENLDPTNPGVQNERNLYVHRDGTVHFVATMDAGTRGQPDADLAGRHARRDPDQSKLTSYDNQRLRRDLHLRRRDGHRSTAPPADPAGAPPSNDVEASQSGRFMADDGRDVLRQQRLARPARQKRTITDVYEYVDGRPQLISAGPGLAGLHRRLAKCSASSRSAYIGLEAVSHNGTRRLLLDLRDAGQRDHNGEYVKFYDARTGGGFPEQPDPLPCEAADECHGAGQLAAAAAGDHSAGTNLGASGNVTCRKKQANKKHEEEAASTRRRSATSGRSPEMRT